jgi:hypothetical protein
MHSDEQGWSEQKRISTDFQKMLSEEVFEEYELCNM